MDNNLFIISYYRERDRKYLDSLIKQLSIFNCTIAVVINIDNYKKIDFEKNNRILILKRKNEGMNIGAWNAGYKYFNDFDNYFFFQDECFIKKNSFYDNYLNLLNNKKVGIVGESINIKWSRPWEEIEKSSLNYNIKINSNIFKRVSFYKYQLDKWNISLGKSGLHLRSLNLAMTKKNLESINGFNIGKSKEECIAAEIAISKKILNLNLSVAQANYNHFYYIGHREWDDSGVSKK